MATLIRNGNMNGRRKTLHPKKHIYTLALADAQTYEFMNDNPSICGYPASYVNSPRIIAKNCKMISVNAAIEIDLCGQINSEYVKGNQWSGPGGQLDFVRGAYASDGGKSFIALHSTCSNDTITKIVPKLSGPVTDSRTDVHYVVTEYGMVNLKGMTMRDRIQALINIAHPDFRDYLREESKHILG
jgi:itaconate CoA-transferase